MLIGQYAEHQEEMENRKRKKSVIWDKITKNMSTAGFKCKDLKKKTEQKWRNLVKAHKKIKDNKKQTGSGRREFRYFNEMSDILDRRHDISPPITGGSGCDPLPEVFEPEEQVPDQDTPNTTNTVNPLGTSDSEEVDRSQTRSAKRRRLQRRAQKEEATGDMGDLLRQYIEIEKQKTEQRKLEEENRQVYRQQKMDKSAELLALLKQFTQNRE